jgi:ABC-type polysaccharide transport system permease subunit
LLRIHLPILGRPGQGALWRQVRRDRFLYALAGLPILYFVIFRYLPMFGIIIAFQDYDPYQGIAGMLSLDSFVGLQHFRNFLRSIFFWNVLGNTIWINLLKLFWAIPAAIVLALLLNEVRQAAFRRTVQTISYLPHFFSAVVAAGMVRALLASQGGQVNPWWLLIARNFLFTIPEELEEAAAIDGANPAQILLKVVLPLSLPIVATIGLWYAVAHWNAWFDAAIYISDVRKLPLQPILRGILEQRTGSFSDYAGLAQGLELPEPPPAESLKAAMLVVTTLPILLIYPFIQRYFISSVRLAGLRG